MGVILVLELVASGSRASGAVSSPAKFKGKVMQNRRSLAVLLRVARRLSCTRVAWASEYDREQYKRKTCAMRVECSVCVLGYDTVCGVCSNNVRTPVP